MSKRPTEEDLGIETTAEEMAPPPPTTDDDYPDGGDPDPVVAEPAPKADEPPKPVPEKDPVTGKFVAKDPNKAAEPAPVKPADPAKPPPGFVDNRALQEARAENKLLMERMTALLEAQQKRDAPKVEAPVVPDKDDPLGRIDHIDSRLARIEGETQAQAQTRQQAEQEYAEVSRALSVARPQFEEAAAADPSITPTYNALLESYARELQFINRQNPEYLADPRAFLGREMTKLENGHIRFAVASGMNVAHYMRELAASRGITGLTPQPGNGAPPAVVPEPKTIAERQAAQQRHMSLGDAPGAEVPAKIDAKALVKMTPSQFRAFAQKFGEAGLDEIMGKA